MWRANFYTKSSLGKIYQWFAGLFWLAILVGSAVQYIVSGEPWIWSILPLSVGFILFLIAKLSVVRKGQWISFGAESANRMSVRMIWAYYSGYFLMIVGFFAAVRH